MTKVLLTHGDKSNERIKENLESYGFSFVSPEVTGDVYEPCSFTGLEDVDVGLVFPGRLMEGGIVDALTDIAWVNGQTEVLTCKNKARCTAKLTREDIDVPDTLFVSNPTDRSDVIDSVEESFEGPVVVKPNSSTRGRGAIKADDVRDISGVFDYFDVIHESSLVFDKVYLVQEYLEDPVDYRVMVIGGDYVGAVVRENDGWKKNVHAGADARGVTPPDGVIEVSEEAAQVLGVDFCGVDVLVSGARISVLEVNARPTVDNFEKYEPEFYDKFAEVLEQKIRS
ncbi:MAG: RimK family alpha-L-glutamate ligase [Halobacteria archaeon]